MEPTQTIAEAVMWESLRGASLGRRFRRQQVIDGFIVDFYRHACALVVEVDGLVHSDAAQAADDAERDACLTR